jgi:hypothetical protein
MSHPAFVIIPALLLNDEPEFVLGVDGASAVEFGNV